VPVLRRVAVLCAVKQEIAPLARRLRPPRQALPAPTGFFSVAGRLHETELLLCAGGVGPNRAAEAAEALFQKEAPELLLVAGVAGALDPGLPVGAVVAASGVRAGAAWLQPGRVLSVPSGDRVREGALLCSETILVDGAAKRAARREAGEPLPLAVEMETAGAAAVAERCGAPWAALRAISDGAEEALPLDFNRLREPDGDLSTVRVALAALAQPNVIPGLVRLGRNTSLAAEALAKYLEFWFRTENQG